MANSEAKDMIVSCWHFLKRAKSDAISLSDVPESVREGAYSGGPVWDHILGYWNASKAKPERVLILKYEEILHDPVGNVEKIAHFIGQPFSDAEKEAGVVESIVELCSLEKLKVLDANNTGSQGVALRFPHDSFFRKGAVGDWVNHITPEMAESLYAVLSDKFCGSGFSFM